MNKTVIGLLRHGQTDWNIDYRLQGVTDVDLNETGRQQARVASQILNPTDWDLLLTSPLSRARETAAILVEEDGWQQPVIEPLLLERSFGEAEGLRHEDWKAKYPDTNAVPGAETLEQLEDRANQLLDQLVREHAGKRILTVSHGALIRKLINMLSSGELPREGERLGNASMSVLVHDGASWQLESYEPRTLGN